jgi:hypothetical protein
MAPARLLIVLLLLALGSIDLAVWSSAGRVDGRLQTSTLLLLSLVFSQTSLAAIWCGLGTAPLPWRLLGASVVAAVWSLILGDREGPGGTTETAWLILLAAQTAVILAVLLPLRARRWRFVFSTGFDAPAQPACLGNRHQFSLGYLLSWITAVAVILGVLQYSVRYEALADIAYLWVEVSWLAFVHSAMATAGVFLLFGRRRPWARVALLPFATMVALAALNELTDGRAAVSVALCLLQLAWLLAGLAVVRVAGYRLERSPVAARA